MRQRLIRNVINIFGFHTKRKIVVIESDDWGSSRMPSKQAYHELLNKKIISANDPFSLFDCLETKSDLTLLFEVLTSVAGRDGKSAVLTANCIMANPDFKKIKSNDYRSYHYEPVEQTFNRHSKSEGTLALWKEGLKAGVFCPQLHGREHVNVLPWLEKLQAKDSAFMAAFDLDSYAINGSITAALNYSTEVERIYTQEVVAEALDLFYNTFGFHSTSFIAPNYTWSDTVERVLNDKGVRYLQGSKIQNVPSAKGLKKRYHYTGQVNRFDQTYLVRNCLFEPSISPNLDYVSICLRHVDNAFFWNKPAIIGSHRLNYVGTLNSDQRDKNLKSLQSLLRQIIKKYPDVVFMSTADMVKLIG
jgi:hypothetical protein